VGKAIGITRDTSLLDEVVKCLFCSAYFDVEDNNSKGSPELIAKAYRDTFSKVKLQCPSAFSMEEEILLDPESISYVHSIIKNIDILDPSSDPLSDLYQTFVGTEVRGNEGQFFTPPQAVNWIIEAINPQRGESIIDPACGAGSFLFSAARHLKKAKVRDAQIAKSIYGVEKDNYLSKLANTHLSLVTLEHSNIICGDSIERTNANNEAIKIDFESSFDIVVANPPFGSKIKVGSKSAKERFDLAKKWLKDKETGQYTITDKFVTNPSPQILFIEICLKLLSDGGRLGVVVPESMISNASSGHVVNYLMKNTQLEAVIGMPENLFKTSGKGGTHTKVCLLISSKVKRIPKNYKIFMAEAKWCGNDSRGNTIPHNDLPKILDRYMEFKSNKSLKSIDNLGYIVPSESIKDFVLAPRYYDPRISKSLDSLSDTHNLISIQSLIDQGLLEIRRGDEVGKLAYGTGDIPFIRTSDISNWEVKLDPKHGLSEQIYQEYSTKQDVREKDILMVKDGTYLIGTCALVTRFDTKIVYQSHLYKIRVLDEAVISPYVLLAALSSKPVLKQIQSKRFTQDIIDSLGNRVTELVLPIPKDNSHVEYVHKIVKKSIEERVESRELARHAKIALIDLGIRQ